MSCQRRRSSSIITLILQTCLRFFIMSKYYYFNIATCLFTSFICAVFAFLFAGYMWAIVFFIATICINVLVFRKSSTILEQFFQPKMIAPQAAKEIYIVLNNLANKAQIKLPILYITQATKQPNMLAIVAKDSNKIIISPTILKALNGPELQAMLAYQVARISSGAARHQAYLACMALLPCFFLHLGHIFPSFGGRANKKIPAWAMMMTMPFSLLSECICRVGCFRRHFFVIDIIALNIGGNTKRFFDGLQKLEAACVRIPDAKQRLFPSLSLLYNVSSLASSGIIGSCLPNVVERTNKIDAEMRSMAEPTNSKDKKEAVAPAKQKKARAPSGKVKRPGITDGPSRSRARQASA